MLSIYNYRDSFYQWDLNQKITGDDLKVGDKIHFHNSTDDTALVVLAYELNGRVVADVPNILLQTSYQITAYRYVDSDNSGSTVEVQKFTVNTRVKPDDYVYTETDVFEIETVINAALTKAKESGEFNGDSAYEVAVKNGFKGTESEWLASLCSVPPVNPMGVDDGKFLQVVNGVWKTSEKFKVIDDKLYLGATVLSEKRLKGLLSLINTHIVKGVWNIDRSSSGEISNITFTSNGEIFNRMKIETGFDNALGYLTYLYYDDKLVAEFSESLGDFSFTVDAYKTVDFGTDGQELLQNEYTWFTNIASKPQITFTIDGTTLQTDEGTLWGDCNCDGGTFSISSYGGYATYNDYGGSGFEYYILDENTNKVLVTDEIKAGGVYSRGGTAYV